MKKRKKIMIASFGLVVAAIAVGMFALSRDLAYMGDVQLHGLNLAAVSDGSHTGTFEHGRFTNTLTVHVQGNRIVGIRIDDDVWGARVTNISDEVFSRVIAAQDTQIDVIAGSTVTMTAYLKAIEAALMGGE